MVGLSVILAVLVALFAAFRGLLYIPLDLFSGKPTRIDVPLPYIPIDIILVSNPDHFKVVREDDAISRVSTVNPTTDLPKWVQLYFAGTRFLDTTRDQWFVPFNAATDERQYGQRLAAIKGNLQKGFSAEDVQQVTKLLQANADEETLAVAMNKVVNWRFFEDLGPSGVPVSVVQDARHAFNQITDAIKPGNYEKGTAAAQKVVEYCAASKLVPGLWPVDAAHNIGAVANRVPFALGVLKEDVNNTITNIFTKSKNCPTKDVPRIATEATTLGGLLRYPTVPKKTVFIMSISKAAGKTGSMWFTFGTGVPERSCPFKPFFEDFMTDVQLVLQGKLGVRATAAVDLSVTIGDTPAEAAGTDAVAS